MQKANHKFYFRTQTADFIIALCLLALGIIVMFQYKTARESVSSQQTPYQAQITEFRARLEEELRKGIELTEENAALNREYDSIIDTYASQIQNADLTEKLDEVKKYRFMAGLTDVKGEGITVTMMDAKAKSDYDPSLFLIHDMDILRVLNELKAAGAQAISINGERIMPVSEIMCAGPTVRVNRNRYPVPYVITAAGNSAKLAETLENSLIYTLLADYDISVKIERNSSFTIKKYIEAIDWMTDKVTEVAE